MRQQKVYEACIQHEQEFDNSFQSSFDRCKIGPHANQRIIRERQNQLTSEVFNTSL